MALKVKNPPNKDSARGFYLCTVIKEEIIFQCGPLAERDLAVGQDKDQRLVLTVEKGATMGQVFQSTYPILEKGMIVAW